MTGDAAISWLARGGAIAAAVAALELLWVRRAMANTGVFAWPVLRAELAAAPVWVRAPADRVMSYRGIVVVLVVQLASALALPWLAHPVLPWLVLSCALVVAIRFRGTYNGGSDAMLVVVMIALGVARSAPSLAIDELAAGALTTGSLSAGGLTADELAAGRLAAAGPPAGAFAASGLAAAGLAYAAAQLVLSYFIAGIAKLRDPAWRAGRAMPVLVRLPQYRVPAWTAAVLSRPVIARLATWSILAFECSFPPVFAHPTICHALLICGAGFHLANAIVFGLNRFLWTWLAAYPALLYWAG